MAALIAAQRDQHGIPHAVSCHALGISRSWFYKWKSGTLPPRSHTHRRACRWSTWTSGSSPRRGVSSGIDMALRLTELLIDRTAAQAAQLMIEYDPQPPFDCGSPAKAAPEVLARVREYASQRSDRAA